MTWQQALEKGVLTSRDVSALFQFSYDKVCRMAREGEIPHLRAGRSLRFSAERLREWLNGSAEKVS